jgi:hypothetical protein
MTSGADTDPICLDCGFCCDGTLFPFGQLEPNEAVPERMVQASETPRRAFQQPCPYHEGACTIYDDRPKACRVFDCDLLKAQMRGEISKTEAREAIKRLRELKERLRTALGPGTGPLRKAGYDLTRQALTASDPAAFRAKHARILVAYAAFEGLIREAFERNKPVTYTDPP